MCTAEVGTTARPIVLLVSADADLRAVLERVLPQRGFDVVTAAHAGHAVLAGLTRNHLDVVVSEAALDARPGRTLADTLRRYHPDLRSIRLAHAGVSPRRGLLVRPFTLDDLMRELTSATAAPTWPASKRTSRPAAR